MDAENIWKQVLEEIRPQLSFNNFKGWILQAEIDSIIEGKVVLKVQSGFHKNQLLARYESLLKESAEKVLKTPVTLEFKIDSSVGKKKVFKETENESNDFFQVQEVPFKSRTILNPKYTLESFVVGLTNNLAFAAAQAVVANPGITYNPLFIYGPSGVGKTHLMQGIGNALMRKRPDSKLIYVSSEKFMNDLVEAIQKKTTGEFRAKYRNCDIFLIDDIQFISGRDATQEAFFHTFNELQGRNSQIIINSDRSPNEISKLEPRLASRFAGGLMVDIQLPDFDTRMAILKAKLSERKENLPEEVLSEIAQNVESNTRELEGKLIQILQVAKAHPLGITPEILKRYIGGGYTNPSKKTGTIDKSRVLEGVKDFFNIDVKSLTGPRRQKEFVLPRQFAMFILYADCKLPYEKIGEMLGGRDHTTIMHGVSKIEDSFKRDREVQRLIIEIRQKLSG